MNVSDFKLDELLLPLLSTMAHSTVYTIWRIIGEIFSSYWYIIIPALVLWVAWEVFSRNSHFHYNSANGYSPDFNRFVGSGVYFLLQSLVLAFITLIFSDKAYLHFWPYALHITVFFSTSFLLNYVGFWVYQKRIN
jgi:hypothetical protein